MTDEANPFQEEAEALDRIARTHDGVLLHRYLRRILETVNDFETDGALRAHNGRRTLARDLMRLMAPGIEGTSDRSDQPILTNPGRPVGTRALSRSAARRAQWESERDTETKPDAT